MREGLFFSLLFPQVCSACQRHPVGSRGEVCVFCINRLPELSSCRCPGCGGAIDGILDLCNECLAVDKRPWRKAVSVYPFSGYNRELIHRFKYRGGTELVPWFSRKMVENWEHFGENRPIDAVVPMPLHPLKELLRGYNQSRLLAEAVGLKLSVPVKSFLKRRRWTPSQAGLDSRARRSNVRNAFSANPRLSNQDMNLLLVDDVITTGFTLAAASEVLTKAGAASVSVLTLARD